VVDAAWVSFAFVAAGAGAFAVAGEDVFSRVLGDAYSGQVGRDLGLLVVWFAPWMLVTVAYSLTLPLLFVVERAGRLVGLAVAALAFSVVAEWIGRELFDLRGIAIALALSTLVVVADMLVTISRRTAVLALAGILRAGTVVGAGATIGFGAAAWASDGIVAAVLGTALYAALLALFAPFGLRQAWAYLRALH
jgi:hypothetical protein